MIETDETAGSIDPEDWFGTDRAERRDAAEHRRRILAEARRLFEERGVESVSMHQIAQAAGVGQGTLYRRYGGKGDLCFDLLKNEVSLFCGMVEERLTTGQYPALTDLAWLVDRLIQFFDRSSALLRALEGPHGHEQKKDMYGNPFYRWLHATVAGLYRRAMESGEVIDLDPAFTADALLAVLAPQLQLYMRSERGYTAADIVARMRALYIDALRCS